MDDLDKRIREANKEFLGYEAPESEEKEEVTVVSPTDLYQERQAIQRDYAKKQYPRGARGIVLATVRDVIEGAGTRSLAKAYKRAEDDREALKEMGDYRRAQLVTNQYMQESFLPAVEVVVNFTSPDELLNSKEALVQLDKYAMGQGSMSGYTAAYIREAYGKSLGQVVPASSPEVTDAIDRVNGLLDSDQMVSAKGLANKIRKKIDRGETIASEDDYQFLVMVAGS